MRKKAIVLLISILVPTFLAGGWLYSEYQKQKLQKDPLLRLQHKTKALVKTAGANKTSSFHETVDTIRTFVNANSVHKIDEEFYSYWRSSEQLTDMILQYARGERESQPHMECSTRAHIMQNMLHAVDIETRTVWIFNQVEDFPAHVILEVYNPDTENWEIQDPDTNIFWVHKDSKYRASINDMISAPLTQFLPCLNVNTCRWDIKTRNVTPPEKLKDYFRSALVFPHWEKGKSLLVNESRFDLQKRIPSGSGGKTFCERWYNFCRNEIVYYKD